MNGDADPRAGLRRECVVAGAGIVGALTALKHLGSAIPSIADHAATLAAAAQLYGPLWWSDRIKLSNAELGLARPNWMDVKWFLLFAALTVAPFAIGHHFWQTLVLHRSLAPRLPAGLAMEVAIQLLAVALPEELFFRGYLQARLEKLWPPTKSLLGVPFGRAAITACALFAVVHFMGEYRPDRLAPFFPALAFAWLRNKTGRITAPVAYHAFCNLLAGVLFACYAP
ncbi:MAG: CPBP family intramembrane metalloprotease [Deltaproteobacteria bacterium]|nr:CPBP family intramembrane metalloprotease [Deltaproteobacteria bacterium]